MTEEEIQKILKLLAEVFEKNGKEIQLAVLYTEDSEEIVLDSRENRELN